ncbi:hypothetical protein ACFYO1_38575 [Nocardia sp. NPDC006044]|uniref:hypothetical protein n=1 Tax=Nocardia sp. NPDC006044 TaxID=3364306 RepID=UPI003696C11E
MFEFSVNRASRSTAIVLCAVAVSFTPSNVATAADKVIDAVCIFSGTVSFDPPLSENAEDTKVIGTVKEDGATCKDGDGKAIKGPKSVTFTGKVEDEKGTSDDSAEDEGDVKWSDGTFSHIKSRRIGGTDPDGKSVDKFYFKGKVSKDSTKFAGDDADAKGDEKPKAGDKEVKTEGFKLTMTFSHPAS